MKKKEKVEADGMGSNPVQPVVIPLVADVCCSSKAFWFNKDDKRVFFFDKRNDKYPIMPDKSHPARTIVVAPDAVMDFEKIPIKDDAFALVVFDPPHAKFGATSAMAKTYGRLFGDWKGMLENGFSECFRILKPGGFLIFKWNDWEVPVREILALTNEKPLFGHLSGKRAKTHWITFMKAV